MWRNQSHQDESSNQAPPPVVCGDEIGEQDSAVDEDQRDALSDDEDKDSASRPPYSYAALIALALESMPEGRATTHDICLQISSAFPYYKGTSDVVIPGGLELVLESGARFN